ncbi:MAG: hypothetical protein EOO69_08905 [Moraxellaceae bacterium]|nr:MAG: hypothetical protein EOO69_08905 [Moraxellaceae bacterium]
MTHSFKLNVGIAICAFGLGYFAAHSKADQPLDSSEISKEAMQHSLEKTSVDTASHTIAVLNNIVQAEKTGKLISQSDVTDIQHIVAKTPEQTISTYLKKAFPKTDLSAIKDKRQFTNRLIDELSNTDTAENNLSGQLTVSSSQLMPRQSENLEQVYKTQEIFAHFDSLGKFPQDSQVFVRWVNQDTGEILLFTPTTINAASQQNWTSFSPADGWKAGNYDVKYYQMNNNLAPIAQSSFTIKQVIQ